MKKKIYKISLTVNLQMSSLRAQSVIVRHLQSGQTLPVEKITEKMGHQEIEEAGSGADHTPRPLSAPHAADDTPSHSSEPGMYRASMRIVATGEHSSDIVIEVEQDCLPGTSPSSHSPAPLRQIAWAIFQKFFK